MRDFAEQRSQGRGVMKYLDQLRHPKWQRKRLEVLNQAGWLCEECRADDRQLHVHHKCYRGGKLAWEYELTDLEALCGQCHLDRHDYLRALGRFDTEKTYERNAISRVLGCPGKGFLPMVEGHVVAGFFRRKYNPCAPDIVLPGNFSYIKKPTEIFCRQSFPVPIFLNSEDGKEMWRYAGDYSVESWTANPKEIEIQSGIAKEHPKIWRVLFLRASGNF